MKKVLAEHVVAVRLDVMQERDLAKKLGAFWTPMVLYVDPAGEGRVLHRWLGYLPPEEFAAQALVGVGLANYQLGRTDKGLGCFSEVVEQFPKTYFAPEAVYWQAVSTFRKMKGGGNAIYEACRQIVETYPESIWAKKLEFTWKYKDFSSVGR